MARNIDTIYKELLKNASEFSSIELEKDQKRIIVNKNYNTTWTKATIYFSESKPSVKVEGGATTLNWILTIFVIWPVMLYHLLKKGERIAKLKTLVQAAVAN